MSIEAGATGQLAATAKDVSGNTLSGRTVAWSSSNTAVATVSVSGVVTGVAPGGPISIIATSEGKTGAGEVTVTIAVVASVAVAPGTVSVPHGVTTQLTATPQDVRGGVLSSRTVTWSSSNVAVATVSPTGLVAGVSAGGPISITATSEGKTGTAQVTVTPPPVATIVVAPPTAAVSVGATTQLSATLRDANNNVLVGRTVIWSTSNAAIATVSTSGLVIGVAVGGPVTITATSEGKTGIASIGVAAFPSTIAFQTGSGNAREIWRVDPDGTNLVRLTNDFQGDYVPAISPDGTKIAFVRNGSLYTMNADGTGASVLLVAANASLPAWSPDGSKIVYTEYIGGGILPKGDIRIVNASGQGSFTVLASTVNNEHHPSWSPDGTTIIYVRDPDSATLLDIYRIAAAGGTPTQLFVTPAVSEHTPAYSPDGSKIAFNVDGNIFVVSATGIGAPVQLTSVNFNTSPSWSPDGSKIAYSTSTSDLASQDIWIMNADGSNKINVTNTPTIRKGNPSWGRKR